MLPPRKNIPIERTHICQGQLWYIKAASSSGSCFISKFPNCCIGSIQNYIATYDHSQPSIFSFIELFTGLHTGLPETQAILKPTQIHKWQINCVSDSPDLTYLEVADWFNFWSMQTVHWTKYMAEKSWKSEKGKWVKWWYVRDTHFWSFWSLCRF